MRPLAKILRLDSNRSDDDKGRLIRRPDFCITNPEYLTVGKGTFVNQNVMMVTPGAGGSPNTSIKLGENSSVGRGNEFVVNAGNHLVLGDFATTNRNCVLIGDVSIGRYCVLAYNVYISSGNHTIDKQPTWLIRDQDHLPGEDNRPVQVGEDVWLGYGVFVKQGIHIGRGAVVGANAVVTKNIPPYTIWAGVPAKQIGTRAPFQPPTKISASEEKCLPYFYSGFCVRQDDLREAQKTACVRMLTSGTIVLAGGKHEELRIKGKWLELTQGELTISLGNQEIGRVSSRAGAVDETLRIPSGTESKDPILEDYTEISLHASAKGFGLEQVEID